MIAIQGVGHRRRASSVLGGIAAGLCVILAVQLGVGTRLEIHTRTIPPLTITTTTTTFNF